MSETSTLHRMIWPKVMSLFLETEVVMNATAEKPPSGHPGSDPQPGPNVTITVNNIAVIIHRGRQTVATIKQVGGVPPTDDLDQLIDGKLTPLPDDGAVTLKGGETFLSHPKDGGSS